MTTQTTTALDREAWLTEAAALIVDDIIYPALPAGHVTPFPYRVSVGFPPRSRANGGRVLAVCCVAEASADHHNEIFVTPRMDDSGEILAALVHELVHQSDNCKSGHKGHFAHVARAVGLVGKLTATKAGDELQARLKAVIDIMGPIPHAKLDIDKAAPKQSTRQIKCKCPGCGFQYYTSTKQLDRFGASPVGATHLCPACNDGYMLRADIAYV